jgi:hypothetical protein
MVPASAAAGIFGDGTAPQIKNYHLASTKQSDDMGPGHMGLIKTGVHVADGTMVIKFERPLKCAPVANSSVTVAEIKSGIKTHIIVAAGTGAWGYHDIGRVAFDLDLESGHVETDTDWKKIVHIYTMVATWGV